MKLKSTSAQNFPLRKPLMDLGNSRSLLGAHLTSQQQPHVKNLLEVYRILCHDWRGYKKRMYLHAPITLREPTKHGRGCKPASYMRLSDPRIHKYRATTSRLPGPRFHNKTPLSNGAACKCRRARESFGTVSVAFDSGCKAPHLTSTCRHRTIW